ncbi:MAG: hypothetical protein J5602_12290 [Clostridia bacterium]|nr:hypothetical protein [Clostridia bacterium]
MKRAVLQAHRGVSTDCPENTMSAFRAAVSQGYGIIELDPKFTKDNRCVVLHDRTVNRTGRRRDGRALPDGLQVAELTLEETRALEFGSWFSPTFAGEAMPLFGEALALSRASGVPLKVDNVIETFTDEQRSILFDEIRRADLANRIGVTCTTPDFVRETVSALPGVTIHYDGFVDEASLEAVSKELGGSALCVWLRFDNRATAWNKNPPVSAESAALAHRFGSLGVWILSEPSELEKALRLFDADIIETTGSLKPE